MPGLEEQRVAAMQPNHENPPRVLGLDWSGARNAAAKIWACILEERPDGSSTIAYLDRPLPPRTPRASVPETMAVWLAQQDFSLAGFDFCFGLAIEQATRLCSPKPDGLRPPYVYGQHLESITAAQFHLQAAREVRRVTDKICKAPFAPTNLRMYRQTYLGLRFIAALGNSSYAYLPWDNPEPDRRLIIEVLPAKIQRWLDPSRKSYKGRSLDAETQRALLLSMLEQLAPIVSVPPYMRDQIISDREGDALDAVFAAVAAQQARNAGFLIDSKYSADTLLEGWIF